MRYTNHRSLTHFRHVNSSNNSFLNLPTSPATHSEAPNNFPLYTVPSSRIKFAKLTRFDDIFFSFYNCARGQIAISHSEIIRNLARDLVLGPRPPNGANGACALLMIRFLFFPSFPWLFLLSIWQRKRWSQTRSKQEEQGADIHELSASSSWILSSSWLVYRRVRDHFWTFHRALGRVCKNRLTRFAFYNQKWEGKVISEKNNTQWNTNHGNISQKATLNEFTAGQASHLPSYPVLSPRQKKRIAKRVMCFWAYLLFLPIVDLPSKTSKHFIKFWLKSKYYKLSINETVGGLVAYWMVDALARCNHSHFTKTAAISRPCWYRLRLSSIVTLTTLTLGQLKTRK